MFKKLIFAIALAAGGTLLASSSAVAGHPHCGHGYGGGGYYSNYAPQYRAYSAPYYGPSRGYGYSGYNSYRPAIGINIGGSPFGYGSGYGGFGGYGGYGSGLGGYRGGSGFSLYLGR